MLEEALTSPTYSPSEAALAMLSFVQVELPAGGSSAEARFFRLFSMLCERVFGAVSNEADNYRHVVGGWLSREMRWERPRSHPKVSSRYSVPSSALSSQSTSSMTMDPVVRLLGTGGDPTIRTSSHLQQQLQTLIEAISKEAEHRPNVRYPFPFRALPRATQEAWLVLLEIQLAGMTTADVVPNENATRLLGSLLKVRPVEQGQLRMYQQKIALKKEQQRRPLQLSPGYNSNINNFSFSPAAQSPATTPSKEAPANEHPNIMLSMLEYYLLMFIRYPLAPPPPAAKQSNTMVTRNYGGAHRTSRRGDTYGSKVYLYLFNDYLEYFIPYSKPHGHFSGFDSLQRPSELFVRFIVELWMHGMNKVESTERAFRNLQRHQQIEDCNLDMSYDLVQGDYDTPVSIIRRSVRYLVARVALDGSLLDAAREWAVTGNTWCLSPTMTILQPHFFNYVRSAFRRASIHASGSPFFAAMEAWLIWLEPWNANHNTSRVTAENLLNSVAGTHSTQHKRKPTMIYPKAYHRSRYTKDWEPYIAANLHLYTEPLALFLRRACELDFSPREFRRSMTIVRRVFRIYTPEIVTLINDLLASRQAHERYSFLVERHETNLGCFCPLPSWNLSLSCLQTNMHNLLEEAYLQHMKKVRDLNVLDRIEAYFQGIFGQGVVSGEEKDLEAIVARAKIIVAFPSSYNVLGSDAMQGGITARSVNGAADVSGIYMDNGLLSDDARMGLINGTLKLSPLDMISDYDSYYAPPQTHEITFFVRPLIRLSDKLNIRLGLRYDGKKDKDLAEGTASEKMIGSTLLFFGIERVNFRFLADYRWLLFILFVNYVRRCIW